MFFYHIALSLGLMTLLFSAAFIYFMKAFTKAKVCCINFIAYLVLILSALSLICTIFFGIKYWAKGEYTHSCPMMKYMEKMYEKGEKKMQPKKSESNY